LASALASETVIVARGIGMVTTYERRVRLSNICGERERKRSGNGCFHPQLLRGCAGPHATN
jgi:hypothetical protein